MALPVEPLSGAAPLPVTPAVSNEADGALPPDAAAPAPSALPDDLLSIPAIQGLMAGQPGALSANIEEFTNRPEGQLISANKDALAGAGVGIYRSLDGGLGVLFNSQFVSDQDIKNADKAGKLTEIAPPFDQVNAQLGQNPAAGPAVAPAGPATPPPASIGALPDASAPPSRKAIMAKIANLNPGTPTSGPAPGAGRILSQILKPVI